MLHKTITEVINSSPNPVVNGSAVMSFAVKPAYSLLGLPTIAGNVRIGISQNSFEYSYCSASIAAGSCTLSSLKPGVNSVVAEFQPAANTTYAGSVSNTLALDVNRISSLPYVVTPLPAAYIGDTVTYTLRVNQAPNPSSIGAPTGTANISARYSHSISVCLPECDHAGAYRQRIQPGYLHDEFQQRGKLGFIR